jgi:hypothetical protein
MGLVNIWTLKQKVIVKQNVYAGWLILVSGKCPVSDVEWP